MITKVNYPNMENISQQTVAQIVTENIKTAHVFKKYGIDFSTKGYLTLEKACENRDINQKKLISELLNTESPSKELPDFDNMELDDLIDFIVDNHHQYDRDALPLMMNYSTKTVNRHLDQHPELKDIQRLTEVLYTDIMSHMGKEESVLFPWICDLVHLDRDEIPFEEDHEGTVNNPVSMLQDDHESVSEIFKQLRKLSNNYQPPTDADNSYRALYHLLEEFETDLQQHIHLENNILFPKAIELEKKINLSH